jgi:hypothetical protein
MAVCARHDARADPATVYVYERGLGGWTLETSIEEPGLRAVDLSGDTLATGVPSQNTVNVYAEDDGTWRHEQALQPSGVSDRALWGTSVAVDGERLVAGGWLGTLDAWQSGRADVYERSGEGLEHAAKLGENEFTSADRAGFSVDVSGDTVAVSAHLDDETGPNAGTAHVYESNGDGYDHVAKLVASDANEFDRFGRKLALDGDVLVAGSAFHDEAGEDAGAAYVFERNGDAFEPQAKLVPDDVDAGDQFGWSVDVTSGLVVSGAWLHDVDGENAGATYAYTTILDEWIHEAKLTPGGLTSQTPLVEAGQAGALFGFSVAASTTATVAGTPQDTVDGDETGSARVFPALAP